MKLIIKLIAFIFFISQITTAACQYQRMGIQAGTSISLKADGKESIPTKCMDETLEAPKSGIKYTNVINVEAAIVSFNGKNTITLQKAIDEGMIEIEGVNLSLENILKAPEKYEGLKIKDKIYITWLIVNRHTLTETEKIEYNRKLRDEYGQGDHTLMSIINKTPNSIKVTFNQNTIISHSKKDGIGSLKAKDVGLSQDSIWIMKSMRDQMRLRDLGFYNGIIDGEIGPESQSAIMRFQNTKDQLKISGKIDPETDKELVIEAKKARKIIQNKLKKLGLYNDIVDGIWGNKMSQAINELKIECGVENYNTFVMIEYDKLKVKFREPEQFINFLRDKYVQQCNPEACVTNNGHLSFKEKCGIADIEYTTTGELKLTVNASGASVDIKLSPGQQTQTSDGCAINSKICYSTRTKREEYDISCPEGGFKISSDGSLKVTSGTVTVSLN